MESKEKADCHAGRQPPLRVQGPNGGASFVGRPMHLEEDES